MNDYHQVHNGNSWLVENQEHTYLTRRLRTTLKHQKNHESSKDRRESQVQNGNS